MPNKFLKHFPGLFLVCVVFAPPIRSLPSLLSSLRVEDLLLAVASIFVLFSMRRQTSLNTERDPLPILFAYLGLCGMIGMIVGVLAFRQYFIVRDLLLLPQIIKYIIIYIVMKHLLTFPNIADTTKRYVLISAFLIAFVGIAQYWNLFDFNVWFSPLYMTGELRLTQMLDLTYNWRVRGTMGNANVYGTILLWFASFTIAHYTFARRKHRTIYLIATALLAFVIALTQSRSSLGLLAIIWTLSLFIGMRYSAKRSSQSFRVVVSILLMVLALWGLSYWVETSERGFGSRLSLSTASGQTSYKARVRDLVQPTYQVFDTPLSIPFGKGPSKTALRMDSHNGYSWILLRFGIVGLALYLGILITLLLHAFRGIKSDVYQVDRAIVLFGFLVVCVWVLVEFTNAIFKLPSLMALNMFAAGWLSAELLKETSLISRNTSLLSSSQFRTSRRISSKAINKT